MNVEMVGLKEYKPLIRPWSSPSCSLSHMRHRFIPLEAVITRECDNKDQINDSLRRTAEALVAVDERIVDHSRIADVLPPIDALFPCKPSYTVELMLSMGSSGEMVSSSNALSSSSEHDNAPPGPVFPLQDHRAGLEECVQQLREENSKLRRQMTDLESENNRLKERHTALEGKQQLLEKKMEEAMNDRENTERGNQRLVGSLEKEQERTLRMEQEIQKLQQQRYEEYELINQLSHLIGLQHQQ